MINVNQITSQLAKMPDQALQQYASMHKNDPYTVALALAESNRRKEMRTGAHMQQGPQPKVVDQEIAGIAAPQHAPQQMLPEDTGIAQLPAQNIQGMAGGGIVAFDEGGEVPSYAKGGLAEYKDRIVEEAQRLGIDPDVALNLFKTESGGNKNAVSNKGAAGLGQLMKPAAQEMGLSEEERFDPNKNITASLGYFKKQLNRFGDYEKAAAAYNWGPGNVNKHLAKNDGILDRLSLPKETANYLTKLMPGRNAVAAERPEVARTAPEKGFGLPKGVADALTNLVPASSAYGAQDTVDGRAKTQQQAQQGTSAPSATGNQNRAWYDRYRDLMTSGEGQRAMLQGVQDVPAALLGAPVDLSYMAANALGRKEIPGEKPMLGSKYLKDKLTALGLREADSTNPDLQNIRSGTEGIASLYSPFKTGVLQPKSAVAGNAARQEAIAAEARAAVENPRLAGPTTSTTMAQKPGYAPVINSEAKALEVADKERALAETERAALLAKEAAAAKAPSMYTAGVNPVGALATAASIKPTFGGESGIGLPSGFGSDLGVDAATEDLRNGLTKGDKTDGIKALPPTADKKGGISSLFDDPMAIMGLQLMASQNPRFIGGVGEAGLGTAKYFGEKRKEESESAYKAALAKHYGVDPMIQRLNALQDPTTAAAYAKMKEMDREPVTKAALFKEFLASPAGMAVSMKPDEIGPAFANYVKSYESVMGPLGGLPAGTKVTRVGP